MELLLSISQFVVAAIVARFTWMLAKYTKELVVVQVASNRVLERQVELSKQQTKLQEAQQRLQNKLAESEVRPLVVLQAELFSGENSVRRNGGPYPLAVTNLGRYGVMVTKLKQYRLKPQFPDQEDHIGTPARWGKQRFPIPLPTGKREILRESRFDLEKGEWVEVIYEDGASGRELSDLWRYTGQSLGFVREWWSKEVSEDEQGNF